MTFGMAVVFLVTYLCWLPFYRNPLYQDQALNYYVGRQWFKGKIPAKDHAMGPGPILYLFYALSGLVAKNNEVLFHFISATYVAVGNLFLFLAAESIYGLRAAVMASILFAFFIFNPRLIGDRFPPEVYMAPPCLAALYFLLQHLETSSGLSALLCGLFLGLGTLIRQGAYLYAPVLFLVLACASSIFSAMWYGLGFAGPHLFWLAYFGYKGALRQYLKTTVWNAVVVVLFGNWEGPGKGRKDPMRVSGDKVIGLIMSNSLTVLPLYLLAFSCIVHAVVNGMGIQTLTIVLLFFTGLALIFPRNNFDCCYWLNAVPWAAILAGHCLAVLYAGLVSPLDMSMSEHTNIVLLLGFVAIIVGFDYRPYMTLDPEKRDRMLDPRKVGHGSWWPTFNKIGDYLCEKTDVNAKVLVMGHAARIYNRSQRQAFFYFPSFNLFRATDTEPAEYARFMDRITIDYPEVIVLAGHMPAFPFNKEPYLQDMARIQERSGIVYKKVKEIDGFPIYFADVHRSYIRAVLRGKFLNRRLKEDKSSIREDVLLFEKAMAGGNAEQAILAFIQGLKAIKKLDEIVFTIGELGARADLKFSAAQQRDMFLALGEAQFEAGFGDDAQHTFLEIAQHWPESSEVWTNLGVVYFQKGNFLKAREMFEKVLRHEPHSQDAKDNMAMLEKSEQSVALRALNNGSVLSANRVPFSN